MPNLLDVRETILQEIKDEDRREVVKINTLFLEALVPDTEPDAMKHRWREFAENLMYLDKAGHITPLERIQICRLLREAREG